MTRPGGGRIRPFLRWLAVQAAVVALMLGGFELYLRRTQTYLADPRGESWALGGLALDRSQLVVDTPRGRRLVPAHVVIRNHWLSHRDVPVDINSLGFRGPELEPKAPGEYRILVLGDSITFGDYLPEDQVWVRRLEADLRASLPGRRIVVVNGGVGGFNLEEEVDLLEERGLALSPDLVVVGFYLNDSRPRWGFPGEDGRGWLQRHSVLADLVYRTLRIQEWMGRKGQGKFRWVRAQRTLDWANDPKAFRKLTDMAVFDWGAAWDPSSWRAIDAGLARLQALSGRSRFAVAVVAFPVSFQVYARFLGGLPAARDRGSCPRPRLPLPGPAAAPAPAPGRGPVLRPLPPARGRERPRGQGPGRVPRPGRARGASLGPASGWRCRSRSGSARRLRASARRPR